MSPFFVSCLWCVFQITLLCAAGVSLSLLVARRYAASSAAVMSATAGAILVATVLVPFPIPQWSLPPVQVVQARVVSNALLGENTIANEPLQRESPSAVLVDLRALLSGIRFAADRDGATISASRLTVGCVATFAALGILVGLLRLCGAFFAVWQIRRGSVSAEGELADCELKGLARTMDCRVSIEVATSIDVESAAVIGWLRPMIVLSTDWKTWPGEQLRAVLAHELAHIVRRDYLWRAVGTIARAAHYYHPLAHWLLSRLAYSQEVAADQLAAQTLGNREKYLKALSQLAIRQDDLLRFRAEPILLPTSSSYLIRRMNMLRTKERTQSRGVNFVVRAIAVGAVVLLAVVTTALRGLAEPTASETPTAQTEGAQNATDEVFQYPPIDPAIIGDNEHGIFVLRIGEILKQDSFKPMIRGLNHTVSVAWKLWLGSPELVEFDLEMIDYVVGQGEFKIKRLERTAGMQHNSQVMFGSNYGIVRFHCDISSWKQWIRKNAPAAKELQHGKITYFQFPIIPALGPKGICVAARDSHTLVFSIDGEHFWEQVEATNSVSARWTEDWNELDKGLFSLIATDKSIEASVEKSNSPTSDAMNQVLDNIQQIGCSFDWHDPTNQICIQMQFFCDSREQAELIEKGIDSVLSLCSTEAKAELEKVDQNDSRAKKAYAKQALEMLNNFKTRTTIKPNGNAVVHLKTSFTLPLEEMLEEFFLGEKEVARRESASGVTK